MLEREVFYSRGWKNEKKRKFYEITPVNYEYSAVFQITRVKRAMSKRTKGEGEYYKSAG